MAEVWTFNDVTEHLLDAYDLLPSGRNIRQARRAILNAYRELPSKHRWTYYQRLMTVSTVAEQTTGTVVYDHTGGAYERMLTLSGATWPSYAAYGCVKLDGSTYKIDEYKSSTIVTLKAESNPGADVASTTYEWFRAQYILPWNFRRATPLTIMGESTVLTYVPPSELQDRLLGEDSPGDPTWYTFRNSGDEYGTIVVDFAPPPSTAKVYSFMAEVSPRELRIAAEATGTITVSSSSTTVTGSGTSFSSFHVGSVMRFSNSDLPPTSVIGCIDNPGVGIDNPYFAQRKIVSVASATSLTIDSAVSTTTSLSSRKYQISDPIDVEPGSMFNYFLRLAEAEFATLITAKDARQRAELLPMQLREAMGADSRSKDMGYPTASRSYRYGNLGDIAIIE